MTNNVEEIKGLVREFYQAQRVIGVDNDDLEPFFLTQGQLIAIDCEEFDLWNEPYKTICQKTKNKFDTLKEKYKIRRVLFLLFKPTAHELKMKDMESLHLMSNFLESVTWGLGIWYEDSARLLTLVEITSTLSCYHNNKKGDKYNNSKK